VTAGSLLLRPVELDPDGEIGRKILESMVDIAAVKRRSPGPKAVTVSPTR
jgi:hypothetical protein